MTDADAAASCSWIKILFRQGTLNEAITAQQECTPRLGMYSKMYSNVSTKRLTDAGVLLVAGTDVPGPGIYYGEALHRELELLVEAGLTPPQALSTATRNAAVLMNEERE